MPLPTDYTGMKFGKLTAIKFSGKYQITGKLKAKRRIWTFRCDCGNITDKLMEKVVKGWTSSCGCAKGKYTGQDALIYSIFSESGAGYSDGDITFEDFKWLIQQECYWCGEPPSNKRVTRNKSKEVFYYNGLDRIDNTKNHTRDNVVTCCFPCNEMKKAKTLTKWIETIQKIYLNRIHNGAI